MRPEQQEIEARARQRRDEAIARINADIRPVPGQQAGETPLPKKPAVDQGSPGYIDADGCYVPNRVAARTRFWNSLFSGVLIVYGLFGLWRDDLYVPGKRGGMHFHSLSAWVMYGAMLFGAAHLAAVVVDHYDRRDNEVRYQSFGEFSKIAGWTLFVLAMGLGLYLRQVD